MTEDAALAAEVEYETETARLPRRRSWPLAIAGALAMVISAVAFALVIVNDEERVAVLVAARDMAAGEVLEPADTVEVLMVVDTRLGMIEAARLDAVSGSVLAVPLVAGTPLTEAMLTARAWPEPGRVATTLQFSAGQFPDDAQPGWTVAVYVPLGQADTEEEGVTAVSGVAVWRFEAVVLTVTASGNDAFFRLEFDEIDAATLASAKLDGAVMVALASDGGG
jgi:hypothetical protein